MGKKKSHFSNKLGNHPLKAQSLDYRWHILRLLKHMVNKKKKRKKRMWGRGKVLTACGPQELYLLPPQGLLALASWRPSARHSLFSLGIFWHQCRYWLPQLRWVNTALAMGCFTDQRPWTFESISPQSHLTGDTALVLSIQQTDFTGKPETDV